MKELSNSNIYLAKSHVLDIKLVMIWLFLTLKRIWFWAWTHIQMRKLCRNNSRIWGSKRKRACVKLRIFLAKFQKFKFLKNKNFCSMKVGKNLLPAFQTAKEFWSLELKTLQNQHSYNTWSTIFWTVTAKAFTF